MADALPSGREFVPLGGIEGDIDPAGVVTHADPVAVGQPGHSRVPWGHFQSADLDDISIRILTLLEGDSLNFRATGNQDEFDWHTAELRLRIGNRFRNARQAAADRNKRV